MVAWWQTHKMLPLDETNTSAHDAWNKWWHNETNIHDWLPITRHIERCVGMRKKFMEYYSTFELTKAYTRAEAEREYDYIFHLRSRQLFIDGL